MLERLYEKHAVPTSIAPVANTRSEHEAGTMSPSAHAHSPPSAARTGCSRTHSWPQCERARNGSSRKKLQEAQLSVTLGKGGRAQWHGARRADASRFRVTRVVYWTAELVADSAQHSQWRRSKALDSDAMVSVGRAERR